MRRLKKATWPLQATIAGDAVDEHKWCVENAGVEMRDWYRYFTCTGYTNIAFKDSEIFTMFKLRWNNVKKND
jgi:hypothetical protein